MSSLGGRDLVLFTSLSSDMCCCFPLILSSEVTLLNREDSPQGLVLALVNRKHGCVSTLWLKFDSNSRVRQGSVGKRDNTRGVLTGEVE